jgi:hypothetical protein
MRRLIIFGATLILGVMCGMAMTHLAATEAHADTVYSVPGQTAKFELKSLGYNSVYQTFRIDINSGDTCYAVGTKWTKVVDDAPPGPGMYDVQLVLLPDAKNYAAVRIDLTTGRSWYFTGTKWLPFSEP